MDTTLQAIYILAGVAVAAAAIGVPMIKIRYNQLVDVTDTEAEVSALNERVLELEQSLRVFRKTVDEASRADQGGPLTEYQQNLVEAAGANPADEPEFPFFSGGDSVTGSGGRVIIKGGNKPGEKVVVTTEPLTGVQLQLKPGETPWWRKRLDPFYKPIPGILFPETAEAVKKALEQKDD